MNGGRAALLLAVAGAALSLAAGGANVASNTAPPPPPLRALPRQVVVFVVDRVSFDEAMATPGLRRLADAGGAGLMTTHAGSGDAQRSSYFTIGSGTIVPGTGEGAGATGDDLAASGVVVCEAGSTGSLGVPPAPRLFTVRTGLTTGGPGPCDANLSVADPAFPGGLRTDPAAVASLLGGEGAAAARAGRPFVAVVDLGDTLRLDQEAPYAAPTVIAAFRRAALLTDALAIRDAVAALPQRPTLVLVITPMPSYNMTRSGDEVTPLIMAEGTPAEILSANGPARSLTSDGTRQDGLVSNVDVAPTVFSFLGLPIPSSIDGQPVRTSGSGPPFGLAAREREYRRTRFPVQIGEVAMIALIGLLAIGSVALLESGRPIPGRSGTILRFLVLCGLALPVTALAGSLLPRFTYGVVVPYLVLTTLLLAAAATALGPRVGSAGSGAFTVLGAVGVVYVVAVGALVGRAFAVPLEGGTMFDGVRSYGLPNPYIGVLAAGALFLAVGWEWRRGAALLFLCGVAAGAPGIGADVGGAITLFAGAGLWWQLRTHRRLGVRELALAGVVTVAGLAVVLVLSRLAPGMPTHATRFVERSQAHGSYIVDTIRHRLGVGVRQILYVPALTIPLVLLFVAVPATIVRSRRRGGALGRALASVDGWLDVMIVLILGGGVAWVVNDTGPGSAAMFFLYAMSALAYPALLAGRGRTTT